ncbi:MAG: hypothetical protein B7X39_11545 [Lysobacterales bacterium 14-68-21]|jgi:hypothetical protein|nr:MAG: hypothetical protein B7X45_11580 [Xanthomonadales bacterium 15-68-25]OZB66124.1 MAG: hypothetical protein B7X39_11545 [Xanthomonadales bacterium 14-68-21]
MQSTSNKSRILQLQLVILAVVSVAILFMWQGNKGFSLWDEGFLWYGIQRVMQGEVPVRDFMSYDPGRYYWSAALMELCGGGGIMAVRVTVAVFQAMGLSVGLLLIARTAGKQGLFYLFLSAVTLMAWMFPRHKLFDISLAIFLIGALAYLVEKPDGRRYFLTGFCVGLIAVFGRNHGVYGTLASLGVIGWLSCKRSEGVSPIKKLMLWGAGVVSGYTPIWLMLLLIPGFASAFWESIRFLFEIKATNIPLPVPWPWRVPFASLSTGAAIREVLVGLFFVGELVVGTLSIGWVISQRLRNRHVAPALVAASFLMLPYAHFAYSRADINHLAQSIFPMLVGILAFLSTCSPRIKWSFALVLCAASVWVMLVFQPGWQCRAHRCVDVEISGSTLQMDLGTARDVSLLRSLASEYAPHGRSFIAVPYWPGAYALLGRKSPMWEIYPLSPRPAAFEREEIKRIQASKPGFVLVFDMPLDGRDALRFQNTHPLTYQYILDNFDPTSGSPNPAYRIFKAKRAVQ